MPNIISSTIFCARSIDKAKNGRIGRWGVAVGQGKKVVDHVKTLDNKIGKTTAESVKALKIFSKNEKLLSYAGKAIDFASRNVTPLICLSSGLDIMTSDDKKSALIKNTMALSAMFEAEHLMKKHMNDVTKIKGIDKIAEKVIQFAAKHKIQGKLSTIISGIAFVTGSCLAYSIGEKFGTTVANKIKTDKT